MSERRVVGVREVDGLVIVFWDQRTIYIQNRGVIYIFFRWYHRRAMFYSNNWKPFRGLLVNNAHLSIPYVIRMASRYEINIMSGDKMPDLSNVKVVKYRSSGRDRSKKTGHTDN